MLDASPRLRPADLVGTLQVQGDDAEPDASVAATRVPEPQLRGTAAASSTGVARQRSGNRRFSASIFGKSLIAI